MRLAILLLVVVMAPAAAAETLGWEACVREAAANNADLMTARANLAAAGERVAAARSGFFPQVSAGAFRSESEGSSPMISGDPAYSASVTATQNLFAGFLDQARVEQAEASRERRRRLRCRTRHAQPGSQIGLRRAVLRAGVPGAHRPHRRTAGGKPAPGGAALRGRTREQGLVPAHPGLAGAGPLRPAAGPPGAGDGARATGARPRSARSRRTAGRGTPVPLSAPPAQPDFPLLVEQAPGFRSVIADESRRHRRGAHRAFRLLSERRSLRPAGARGRRLVPGRRPPHPDRQRDGADLQRRARLLLGPALPAPAWRRRRQQGQHSAQQLLVQLRHGSCRLTWNRCKSCASTRRSSRPPPPARSIARSKYNNGLMSFEDWDRIENDLILLLQEPAAE
ncbi:MAG: TolC family protein [Comamonadaceae bacterium]|nr:TolC family protein [Comamonadaceae bacterium]